MGASNDYMQQLLGGLLAYQPPQVDSGLLGQMTAPYGGTQNLAMSLLANSGSGQRFPAILGKSLQDSQQLQVQQAMQRLQMAQGAESLGLNIQKNQALSGLFGSPASPTAASASVPQLPAGGPGGPPQGSAQTAQQPQQFAASQQSDPGDWTQMPINGIAPDVYKRGLVIGQGMKASEAEEATRKLQLQSYQQRIMPKLFQLDTLMKSDQPLKYVGADPALSAAVQQQAQRMGMTQLNDANARTVLASMRNQIAARASLPEEAPAVQMQTQSGPLGSLYQRDPLSGKLNQVRGEEGLHQIIDAQTGQPKLVTTSEAVGKQPFNTSIFGAANMSDQALQFAADTYRTTGKMPAAMGRNPAMQAKILEKVASDAAASGDTAGSIAARQGALKANGQAMDLVTKKLAVIEPATKKLDLDLTNLLDSANKIGGVSSPIVNKAIRAWQQGVTGDGEVAKLVLRLNEVEGEYAKLNSGGYGAAAPSVTVRKEAHEVINKYMSAGTLDTVAAAMRQDGQNALLTQQQERDRLHTAMGGNAPNSSQLSTDSAQGATPAAAPTKVIGGKTYVSLGGGRWALK